MKIEQSVSETSAYKIQTPGELPRRKYKTFRTGRKFEIKSRYAMSDIFKMRLGLGVGRRFCVSWNDELKFDLSKRGEDG